MPFSQQLKIIGINPIQLKSQLDVIEKQLSDYLGYKTNLTIDTDETPVLVTVKADNKEITMRSFISKKVYRFIQEHENLECTEVISVAAEEHEKNIDPTLLGSKTYKIFPLALSVIIIAGRLIYLANKPGPHNLALDLLITFVVSYVVGFVILFLVESFIISQ